MVEEQFEDRNICIQETWLAKQDLISSNSLHKNNSCSWGISPRLIPGKVKIDWNFECYIIRLVVEWGYIRKCGIFNIIMAFVVYQNEEEILASINKNSLRTRHNICLRHRGLMTMICGQFRKQFYI